MVWWAAWIESHKLPLCKLISMSEVWLCVCMWLQYMHEHGCAHFTPFHCVCVCECVVSFYFRGLFEFLWRNIFSCQALLARTRGPIHHKHVYFFSFYFASLQLTVVFLKLRFNPSPVFASVLEGNHSQSLAQLSPGYLQALAERSQGRAGGL